MSWEVAALRSSVARAGYVVDGDPSKSSPSDAEQPSAGSRHPRCAIIGTVWSRLPSVEGARGGARIHPAGLEFLAGTRVFAGVVQDVAEREADLSRGLERLHMVAVWEHLAAPAEVFVEALGQSNEQPFHTELQRHGASALHDEMHVVALNREVNDAHAVALCGFFKDPKADLTKVSATQVREVLRDLDGHVHRMPVLNGRPPAMGHARAFTLGLSTCAGSSPTALPVVQRQLFELSSSTRH